MNEMDNHDHVLDNVKQKASFCSAAKVALISATLNYLFKIHVDVRPSSDTIWWHFIWTARARPIGPNLNLRIGRAFSLSDPSS